LDLAIAAMARAFRLTDPIIKQNCLKIKGQIGRSADVLPGGSSLFPIKDDHSKEVQIKDSKMGLKVGLTYLASVPPPRSAE